MKTPFVDEIVCFVFVFVVMEVVVSISCMFVRPASSIHYIIPRTVHPIRENPHDLSIMPRRPVR